MSLLKIIRHVDPFYTKTDKRSSCRERNLRHTALTEVNVSNKELATYNKYQVGTECHEHRVVKLTKNEMRHRKYMPLN